ncbi:N-6 DNA methylase [Marinicella sp. S1101]|uniref:HsdM family class I SAM-dependent methyltransferase n=1 Tax=Marinicella marina TaxID=2996016 RepID=UPI002260A5CB|nr:N-6 DNA methylase [Marinicella marina]MCX7553078.1 N-6 DNA methylase [Marinicella marina]
MNQLDVKKRLGQFYTKSKVSDYICSKLKPGEQSSMIDLCAGDGSLIEPYYQLLTGERITACDIDQTNISLLNKRFPEIKALHTNSTDARKIKHLFKSYDLAVCNPPFITLKFPMSWNSLLEASFHFSTLKYPAEVLFFLINMRLLNEEGRLAIILPDRVLTGSKYYEFRKFIFTTFQICSITELYSNAFKNTEVKCHVVIAKKTKPEGSTINISKLNENGALDPTITTNIDDCIERSDYSYHKSILDLCCKKNSLESIGASITRGSKCKSAFHREGVRAFHTDSFKAKKQNGYKNMSVDNIHKANKGDVLIPRVGTRCLQNATMVTCNDLVFSDSVYRIRAPQEHQNKVWKFFSSSAGKQLLVSISKGVSARFVAKADLLRAQIF